MHPKSGESDHRTQLLPNSFDYYARVKPDAIFAEYTVSPTSYDHGYRPVTYKELANIINGLAWWLTEYLGTGDGEILAYMGLNDVRYPALILAALKAGYCVSRNPLYQRTSFHCKEFNMNRCS